MLQKDIKNKKGNLPDLVKYALGNGYTFSFTDVTIVEKERDLNRRLVIEMLHIKQDSISVNNRSDFHKLSHINN